MNELIKTLQIWSENPIGEEMECNLPIHVIECRGIPCKECPLAIGGEGIEITIKALGEFNERTNKNIKPNFGTST